MIKTNYNNIFIIKEKKLYKVYKHSLLKNTNNLLKSNGFMVFIII